MEIDEVEPSTSNAEPSTSQFDQDEPNTDSIVNTESEEIENIESHLEESDEDEMTSDQALQALESAWLNEKFAPELLPHENDLVETMLAQIQHMEKNIKLLKKGDIRLNIHNMEISRIRFILSSYLRARLNKIEEFAIHLLKEDAQRSPDEAVMTPAETRFAREYIASVESLFTSLALQHMPTRVKEFELDTMASVPNLNKHVFVKANKDALGIMIPGADEEVDFQEGSQHIIQYSAISHLVKSGNVQLI